MYRWFLFVGQQQQHQLPHADLRPYSSGKYEHIKYQQLYCSGLFHAQRSCAVLALGGLRTSSALLSLRVQANFQGHLDLLLLLLLL